MDPGMQASINEQKSLFLFIPSLRHVQPNTATREYNTQNISPSNFTFGPITISYLKIWKKFTDCGFIIMLNASLNHINF